MIDLTTIINAVFALLAAIVTWKVIPWIKERTTQEQRSTLQAVVRTLVFAAEQIYGAGKGSDKMDYVVSKLVEQGFTVDRAMIEATVKECLSGIEDGYILDTGDEIDLNVDHWSLEQLKSFCECNGVPCGWCEHREDYLSAIQDCIQPVNKAQ